MSLTRIDGGDRPTGICRFAHPVNGVAGLQRIARRRAAKTSAEKHAGRQADGNNVMHPLLNCRLVSLTRISGLGYRRCRRRQSSVARSSRLYSIVPRVAEMPAPQRRGGQDHAFYPTITQLLRGKNRDVVCCRVFTVKIKELVDITL